MDQLIRRSALASMLALALSACTGSEPADDAAQTCDLIPTAEISAALDTAGQDGDDLQTQGTAFDPKRDGRDDGGPRFNECTAGDPNRATVRISSVLASGVATGEAVENPTDQDVTGASCAEFQPLPDSVDAVGGTCVRSGDTTDVRGQWGDTRITVQLYRAQGAETGDREQAIDIAQKFAEKIRTR